MQTLGNTENILSFPFYSEFDENGEDDRTYVDKDWRTYFKSFIRNGVYYNPGTSLQVLANSGFVLTLKAGKCFIEGAIYEDTKDFNFSIEKPDLILGRKDIVIARKNNTERRVKVIYVPGKAAGIPLVPDLIRNDDIYDIKLCDINIRANASSISQADISDTRLDNNVCGKVTHVFDQVDTTGIYNQYEAAFIEELAKRDVDFNTWFDSVKDILDGDIAGNLTSRILALEQKEEGGVKTIQRGVTSVAGNVTISAVNMAKSVITSVSKGSSGTVATNSTLGGQTITGTLAGYTTTGTLAGHTSALTLKFSASGSSVNSSGSSSSNFNNVVPATGITLSSPATSISLIENSATLSGGTTNLTTKQFSAKFVNSTTINCDGAVEWQVIEYK